MKKKTIKKLQLDKSVISKFHAVSVVGGSQRLTCNGPITTKIETTTVTQGGSLHGCTLPPSHILVCNQT